ncbi:MAG: hypothetical protein C5B51_00755 [Terriglobia bacterium]|nr:MAG: hypothetical protein C5B51_00755 [Terriglobia bacterium]
MTRRITALSFALVLITLAIHGVRAEKGSGQIPVLQGRLVAAGIPGVSAVAPVGTFLPGGPIPTKFPAYIQPGQVLDPKRILVGSTSNFGEPLSDPNQLPGSFLSIDPTGTTLLVIPSTFAAGGGQASTLNGFVRMYSAQNPAFLNSINNPAAPTANFTGVSNPLGMSINNAFGRLWPANAPYGLPGIGSSTILDPPGEPLAGAPNPTLIGGVYAGSLTNRQPQVIPGALNTGAVGTAFLGHSPDGSGKAVFAVVCADGSIVQEQTLKGLDGLAPTGTVNPLLAGPWNQGGNNENHPQPRVGALLNYSPSRILYVSEPFANSIAVISLTDDGVVFHVGSVSHIYSSALNGPIDLAPVMIETSDPNWASNTTLDVQADFYVANRGDNTIVHMRQDGTVVAQRGIQMTGGQPLGALQLNGIASSPDGTKIWVTLSGPVPGMGQLKGAVMELPAF